MKLKKSEFNEEEKELSKTWNSESYPEPIVTVICMSYNHEKYIASALDGFLKQRTSFPFIIFVHDDCSTDQTASIIQGYKMRFPHIINFVSEKENQYSKNDGSLEKAIYDNIHTRYVAECEGDDYWTDENKLEEQVLFLENHKDFSFSITNGKTLDVTSGQFEAIYPEREKTFASANRIITLTNAASLLFPPTASYVYRYDDSNQIKNIPECFNDDMRFRLYYLTRGKCIYLNMDAVVYRINVKGSAMATSKKQRRKTKYLQELGTCRMIDYIDQLSGYEYSEELWKIKSERLKGAIEYATSMKILADPYFKRAWNEFPLSRKIVLAIKMMVPDFLYEKLRKS